MPGLLQFVTFRLHDSVPQEQIQQWKEQLNWQADISAADPICAELRRKVEVYEDAGHGQCYLREPGVAVLVEKALRHFDGQRYSLLEWSIMPNHVHVLIEASQEHPLERVVHSWKSFTAKEANKLLGRTGPFWMREYFDRYVRDRNHYEEVATYIRSQGPGEVAGGGMDTPRRQATRDVGR